MVALLGYAVVRLSGMTLDAWQYPFDAWHWSLLVANTAFMAHSEGYKGFQQSYAPRVVARARYLMQAPSPVRTALAPFFCMGYFGTTRRRLRSTYLLTVAIVALIFAYQHLSQPWRGILDAGVVVGLTWGIASIGAFTIKAFGPGFDISPELPAAQSTASTPE